MNEVVDQRTAALRIVEKRGVGRLILYAGHRSVPFASLLVDEMIPDLDGLGVAHRISRSREPLL